MRTILIGAISLVFVSITPSAHADPQDDALAALAACRAIKADQVRLACMDAATRLLDDVTSAAPSPPSLPAVDPAIAAQAAAAERAAIIAEREALAAERAELASERAAIATTAPAVAPSATELAVIAAEREALATERAELASERAAIAATESAQPPRQSLLDRISPDLSEDADVQIVKIVRRSLNDRLRFFTDDGLILDQAQEKISFKAPNALPAEATISFGALGSKWITFADQPGRKYKVSLNRDQR